MISDIFSSILTAAGGTAAVVGGLSGVIGTIIVNRIKEKDKTSERFYQRNSEAQFKLYNDVWSELQDLKVIADRLWERATEDSYHAFVASLFSARLAIHKGRLIMDERDFQRLSTVLSVFENFHLGKKRIIEFRTRQEVEESYRMESQNFIQNQIEQNRHYKEEYEKLLDDVVSGFRRRIGFS